MGNTQKIQLTRGKWWEPWINYPTFVRFYCWLSMFILWTEQYGTVHNTQRYFDDLYRPCMMVIDGKSGDASPLLKPYQKNHVRTSRCMAEVLTEVPPLSWPLIYDAINISTMNPIYWSYSSTWLTMGYQLVCIALCYVPCWDIILHQCISICNLYAVCVLMVT